MKVIVPELPTRYDHATNARIPSIDLNPAAEYGELQVIIKDHGTHQKKIRIIKDFIDTQMEPNDHILAVGDVILVAASIAYAVDTFGRTYVLRWDKHNKQYYSVEVTL